MKAYKNAVERASEYMLELIQAGAEFPDAAWKAAQRFNVQQHHIEDNYDDLGFQK